MNYVRFAQKVTSIKQINEITERKKQNLLSTRNIR